MKLTDISDASRLATKLTSLTERRAAWEAFDVNTAILPRRINANGGSMTDRLPGIDDDMAMHSAIAHAIVAEYDRRVAATKAELKDLGVEL